MHRLSPRAQQDLDEIWLHVAKSSGSVDIATRLAEWIADRFLLLAAFPYAGRARDEYGAGTRTFAVGEYVIFYCLEGSDVVILRVVHGKRDMDFIA